MRPAYDDTDHGDRLTRLEGHDREVASRLAAQTIQIDALTEKIADGFTRLGAQLAGMTAQLQQHGTQLQSLQEARGRWHSAGKWAAGIVSAVVVAALVMGLGLRR